MLFTYPRLRDGVFLASILLYLLSFLLSSNGEALERDGSLQKALVSDEHREPLLLLFMCAISLGFSFFPNLLVETLQIQTTEEAIDSFILERYIIIWSFTTPSLGGLCGVFYEYEHTANLLLATVGVSWTMFGYIATRVLERSAYTKIWTRGVILGLFLIHNIFLSVVTPFGNNFTMNKIFGTFVAVVTLSYHVKYLRSLDVKQILFSGDRSKWKESIVVYFSIGVVIYFILQIIKVFVFGGIRHDATFYSIESHLIINVGIFLFLATIFNSVPRTNLAASKSTSASLKNFIRNMCHEIRTPLCIARMGLSTIKDMILSSKDVFNVSECLEMKEILDDSLESMDISVELWNEALQIDAIESGLFTSKKNHVNLGSFIRKTVSIFHGKYVSKNITFDHEIWKERKILRTIVNIDESKMVQILRNFLMNALKFTPEGGTVTINAMSS